MNDDALLGVAEGEGVGRLGVLPGVVCPDDTDEAVALCDARGSGLRQRRSICGGEGSGGGDLEEVTTIDWVQRVLQEQIKRMRDAIKREGDGVRLTLVLQVALWRG